MSNRSLTRSSHNSSLSNQGKGAIQTYWLTGVKEAYIEHANIIEAGGDVVDNEILSDYHPAMYEMIERKKSPVNVINRSSSIAGRCPFSGL